jgi:hypothetical protein
MVFQPALCLRNQCSGILSSLSITLPSSSIYSKCIVEIDMQPCKFTHYPNCPVHMLANSSSFSMLEVYCHWVLAAHQDFLDIDCVWVTIDPYMYCPSWIMPCQLKLQERMHLSMLFVLCLGVVAKQQPNSRTRTIQYVLCRYI